MEQIIREWEAAQERKKAQRKNRTLADTLGGFVDQDQPNERDGCLICSI